MAYIIIADTIYPLDTDADVDDAKAALRASGLDSAEVFVGDPDGVEGDSYPNGQVLWA